MRLFSSRADQSKTKPETIYGQIQCTPLADLLSISIGNRLDDVDNSISCEIYGKIRVLDTRHGCEDELFSFFNKDEDNPESVRFDDPLLLITPSPTPVIGPSKDICLDICLFIRRIADNKVVVGEQIIVSEKIILEKKSEECEEFHDIEIDSQEDNMIFARVQYSIIQYAVAATIDVLFFSKDDKFDLSGDDDDDDDYTCGFTHVGTNADADHIEDPTDMADLADYDKRDYGDDVAVDVSGTVKGHSSLEARNGKDWLPILLFEKSTSQSGVQVKSGSSIELSRSVVILPAYSSSLVIDADLFHREGDFWEPISSKNLEFKLESKGTFKKDLVGKHGARFRVRVTWNQSYIEEAAKAMEERQAPRIPRRRDPVHWLEMFSVVLYRKDFKPFSFYGDISVFSGSNRTWTFHKDKNDPQIGPESGALLKLQDPNFHDFNLDGCYLAIVDLRDAETGDTVSMGTVQWDNIVIRPWLDKRLCSIVRGEQGFAVVHYTAFFDGIRAALKMELRGEHLPSYVYGKIVARYSTYEYSTAYDKKYYQTTLFDNDSEDCGLQSTLTSGSCLPLLKPVVCLARGSSLIIEANLRVSSKRSFDGDSQQGSKFLQTSVELNPDSGSHGRLGSQSCFIDVHVQWYLG